MQKLRLDLSFALRQMRRKPLFALTIMATLALAIGVNTAVFSLVNALMLKPLPYPQPERIGTVYAQGSDAGSSAGRFGIDYDRWELLQQKTPALITAISGSNTGVNLKSGANAEFVQDGRISTHYLDVLGIHPWIGRSFTAQEDQPHSPKVALLSYALWHRMFGSNQNILGRTVTIKDEPYTIIGVLPKGVTTPLYANVYTALQPSATGEGAGTNFDLLVRLRPGASWPEAKAQINQAWAPIARKIEVHHPGMHLSFSIVTLQKADTQKLGPEALALLLAAGMILLIACANLAGLMLVRMSERAGEMAVRLALGASRWQVERPLWIENLILAGLGGMTAIGVGFAALHGLIALLPQNYLPVDHVALDGRVLLFTLLLSLLTCVLFGMFPAASIRKIDLRMALAQQARTGSSSHRLRRALIAGQIALTLILLSASGLLIRSLIHLETLAPNFNPHGVTVAQASLEDARYNDHPDAFRNLLTQSIAAIKTIPGVEDAAVGLTLPWQRALNMPVEVTGTTGQSRQEVSDMIYVTPGYFHVLAIPLIAGRAINSSDGPDSQMVAVVNQAFAQRFYAGENPVGHYIGHKMLIVGEVRNTAAPSGIYEGAPLMTEQAVYIPAAQVPAQDLALIHLWFEPNWIVRTAYPIPGLTYAMQEKLSSVAPNLPFSGFFTMEQILDRVLFTQRIEVALLSVMAILALLLSAIGIFSLVAYLVRQRTREIGIRMALGSTRGQAIWTVARPAFYASLTGLVAGLLLCILTVQALQSAIYGIKAEDPANLLSAAALLALIAAMATFFPALKVTSIDPAQTLREE